MKHLKLIALTAFATTLAFAGTASGTELYSGASTLGTGTDVELQTEGKQDAVLTATGGTFINTCTNAGMKGSMYQGGSGSTVVLPISSLWFESCDHTTTSGAYGALEIHHIAGTHNGTITAEEFHITVHLPYASCGYTAGAGVDAGRITGGTATTHAIVDWNAVLTKVTGGFLCPGTIVWSATYTVANPHTLNVRAS